MADPIDRKYLEHLAVRFGAEFLIELIDIFIAQGRDRLEAAERGIAGRDPAAIAAAAHALRSSAGNLGAATLGEIAGELERNGSSGASTEALEPLVAALAEEFSAACGVLETIRTNVAKRIG